MPYPKVKKKRRIQYEALAKLNSFLDASNPRLVRFLVRMWDDQSAAITYKELREALLRSGGLTPEILMEWQQDYSVFLNNNLKPMLWDAVKIGGAGTAASLVHGGTYDPFMTGIENWLTVHGGEWVTQMTVEAQDAIASLTAYSAGGDLTVDELARVIRPIIGLTEPQANSNMKFYLNRKKEILDRLLEKNPSMKPAEAARQAKRRARESAYRYAARQHRERAMTIAETELAFAYNKGADDAVNRLVNEGLLPKMKAVWSTAADELVCEECAALDGVEIELGASFNIRGHELFPGAHRTPPAHPHCRCALAYIEA